MKKYAAMLSAILILSIAGIYAQEIIPLYKDAIPNSKPAKDEETITHPNGITIVAKISKPTLTIFLPEKGKANGAAVVICPGGGYWVNAMDIEGYDEAKQFAQWGIAAFVLKYRIPDSLTCIDPSIAPLQDAQQAIYTVRLNAKKWNINPAHIGIMGFSAGGHLASTAGTHFTKVLTPDAGQISVRPDFMMLIYAVITADTNYVHKGSFEKLLGKNPSEEKLKYYSNELQVTDATPPAFLAHANDDNAVSPLNSILFYEALRKHHINAELHIYQNGGHGFGMHVKDNNEQWMERCKNWMDTNGWLK